MTPRSVQIWFQNRRQRLLKPQMRGEGEGGGEGEFGEEDLNARDEGAVGAGALAGLAHHGAQQRSAAHAAMQMRTPSAAEAPAALHTTAMGCEVQEAGHAMAPGMDGRLPPATPHYPPGFAPPQTANVPSSAQMMLHAHAPHHGVPSPSTHAPPSVAAPPPVTAPHPYPVSGPVTAAHLVAAGACAPLLRGDSPRGGTAGAAGGAAGAAGVGGASAIDGSQDGAWEGCRRGGDAEGETGDREGGD